MVKYALKIRDDAFDCCGSAAVSGFWSEAGSHIINMEEALNKLKAVEIAIHHTNRKNMAVAVLNRQQHGAWEKALTSRGWMQVGNTVVNQKTNNQLFLWQCDFTKQVIEKPTPPAPVNGFNPAGARLDRRDESRSFEVGPRSARSDAGGVKEHFIDVNEHRILFVDLPVFNRGQLRDEELNFYSIRLSAGGNSYSWLQGGTHRFPQARVNNNGDMFNEVPFDDDDDDKWG